MIYIIFSNEYKSLVLFFFKYAMCPNFVTAWLTSDSQKFYDVNPMLAMRRQCSDIYEVLKNKKNIIVFYFHKKHITKT
jgi:hypothetical protein